MKNRIRNFDIQNKLGSGSYGVIYKAINKATKETCVLKQISLTRLSEKARKNVPSTTSRRSTRRPSWANSSTLSSSGINNRSSRRTSWTSWWSSATRATCQTTSNCRTRSRSRKTRSGNSSSRSALGWSTSTRIRYCIATLRLSISSWTKIKKSRLETWVSPRCSPATNSPRRWLAHLSTSRLSSARKSHIMRRVIFGLWAACSMSYVRIAILLKPKTRHPWSWRSYEESKFSIIEIRYLPIPEFYSKELK